MGGLSQAKARPAMEEERTLDPSDLWRLHPRGDYFLARGGTTLGPPITANIALTNKCNLRCEICGSQKYLDQTETRRRHMAFETFSAVADTLFPFLVTVELNSQGDPLIYPRIIDVIESIARHGCEMKVQTNGTLFTDAVVDALTAASGEVNLSLDAVGPKFDEVRQGGLWSAAERGLERFLAARNPKTLSVHLYPTVTRRTIGEAVNVVSWAAAHDVDSVVFHRYSPIQDSFEEAPSDDELEAMRDVLMRWAADNKDPIRVRFEGFSLNGAEPHLRKRTFASGKHAFRKVYAKLNYPIDAGDPCADPELVCTAPVSYAEIGLDGQLSACCRSQESPIGHATSVEAFADAWFGPNYQRIRGSLRRGALGHYPLPDCEGCMASFAPRAAAGRRAVSYDEHDRPEEVLVWRDGDLRLDGMYKIEGHCFMSRLPGWIRPGHFDLWENDQRLGPSETPQDAIRSGGEGRFLIADRRVYWAASDNTDPRKNARTYVLRLKPVH
jgi:MoaA/NifB/PqqE/SkfB family radical SAM enzyme